MTSTPQSSQPDETPDTGTVPLGKPSDREGTVPLGKPQNPSTGSGSSAWQPPGPGQGGTWDQSGQQNPPPPPAQPGPGFGQEHPGYVSPGMVPGGPGAYTPPPSGPGHPHQGYGPTTGAAVNPSDERLWATLGHIAPMVVGLITAGWLGWLATLVIYLIYKDRSPFVRAHTAQALNFQIMVLIGVLVSYLLMLVLIGFLTIAVVAVLAIVFPILAAVAANRGERYSYPLTPRMIS